MPTGKGRRIVTLLLKFKQFGLSIKLKMNVPKELKIRERRLMVGGFLYHASQAVLCAPMIFICLSITNKSSLLCCSYSSHLLRKKNISGRCLMALLRYIIEEREPLREKSTKPCLTSWIRCTGVFDPKDDLRYIPNKINIQEGSWKCWVFILRPSWISLLAQTSLCHISCNL